MTQLRKRMMKNMTVRGLAENKMRLYLHSVSGLARYCKRSPERISAQEAQNYLLHLHEERGLTWQICNCTRHWQTTFHHTTLCGLLKKGWSSRQESCLWTGPVVEWGSS